MGIVGIGLIVAALLLGSGELDRLGGGPSGDEVRLVEASDFDPEGGDGEHPEDVEQAIDGNPTGTAWATETYDLEDYGNKSGVGIIIEAAEPVDASAVELRMAEAGADVEVYAAPGATNPPEDLDSWSRVVGEAADIGTRAKIDLTTPSTSALYLIWFTKLPEADDNSGFRAEVADIRLLQ
jgi:hypothetical protein